MKRISDLYKNIYNIENIRNCFNEVCRNTKSKSKVQNYNDYKAIYINRIYNILKNREYVVGPSNVFTIHEPKERRIVSQGMIDKTINHLVSRYILYPAILPCLLDVNVASRANMGTKEGLRLANEYHRKMKRKLKKKAYLYHTNKLNFNRYICSRLNYSFLIRK